jgi:hypothetical protein
LVRAHRPALCEQYLAPQFTCGCRHKMVLEFRNGRTRLHNIGQWEYFEAGTYSVVDDELVWDLDAFDLKLLLTPTIRGLDVTDDSGARHLHFSKESVFFRFRGRHDLSQNTPSKKPLSKYIGNIELFWNTGGA